MMNVYDFDKTIYDGDSTVDFYWYCLLKHPKIVLCLWEQILGFFLYSRHRIDTTAMKERFFSFLLKLDDVDKLVISFWACKQNKIKSWYLQRKKETDIIISASPAFLLEPICKELGISEPIATRVNRYNGKIQGKNCKGEEKKRRFCERYADVSIEQFYSDSKTDQPLADMAKEAFLVDGDKLYIWSKDGEKYGALKNT